MYINEKTLFFLKKNLPKTVDVLLAAVIGSDDGFLKISEFLRFSSLISTLLLSLTEEVRLFSDIGVENVECLDVDVSLGFLNESRLL